MQGPVGEKSGDEAAVGADVAGGEGVGCTVECALRPGLVAADVLQAEAELVRPEVAGLVERLAVPEKGAGDGCSLRGGACPCSLRICRSRDGRHQAATSPQAWTPGGFVRPSASVCTAAGPSRSPAGSPPTATSAMSQTMPAPSES